MTPLPKRRHSTRRGGKRVAALRVGVAQLITCPQCQAKRLPHRVCKKCGYYNGKEVIKPKTRKNKQKT